MQVSTAINVPNTTSIGLDAISLQRKFGGGDNVAPINSITSGDGGAKVSSSSPPSDPSQKQAAKLESAASQFEELFVSLMLKQMRETLDEGLFGKESSDSFGAIFDLFMGKHLASANPLGIGKAVSSYLKAGQNSE